MIFFANCKINLGLDIIRRREDGYHDIETVMYPIAGFYDAIELVPATRDSFTSSGIAVDCPEEKNLCLKARDLMRRHFNLPQVGIHLHKAVPFGAGLGGGSADASFTIKGLNTLFGLGLTVEAMEELAAGLGSDTVFFVRNRPALASGRGEILSPVETSLKRCYIIIVKPPVGVSTAEAYRGVTTHTPAVPLAARVVADISQWRTTLTNDFEEGIFATYPILRDIKSSLYGAGASYASMTGSGSAIFGISDKKIAAPEPCTDMVVYQGYME